jgi:fructose-1,6-bisphosphatase/inositol monophosphatase family enzyme
MTAQAHSGDLAFGRRLAARAGQMIRAGLGAQASTKGDGTPVTDVDKRVNAFVAEEVAERGDAMLGEEDAQHVEPVGGRVWVCDPVDGTWLLTAGVPLSVFSLALVEDGRPVVGIVHDPWTGRMIYAVDGGAARSVDLWGVGHGRPIRVNTTAHVPGACLVLPGGRVDAFDAGRLNHLAIGMGCDLITTGSAVHDASMVAVGFAAAAVYPYTSPWDMAAIAVITTAAGGRITDLYGQPQRYDREIRGAIISNTLVHAEMLELVAAAKAGA